jgi:hypothetical protein
MIGEQFQTFSLLSTNDFHRQPALDKLHGSYDTSSCQYAILSPANTSCNGLFMPTPKVITQRVRKMADQIGPDGQLGAKILDFLQRPDIRDRMIQAADVGTPPAAAISGGLVEAFGLDALDPHAVRRFIGYAIRAIMGEAGYEPASAGIRVPRDPLFSTASTYRALPRGVHSDADSLLVRLIESLNVDELERARFYIERKLGPKSEGNGE